MRLRPAWTSNWPQQAEPRPNGAEALIHEALLEKCDVDFDQLPLMDALRPLAKPRQVQVYIDHKALGDAGVGAETPITCSVKGLTYMTALKLLLDDLDMTYLGRHASSGAVAQKSKMAEEGCASGLRNVRVAGLAAPVLSIFHVFNEVDVFRFESHHH